MSMFNDISCGSRDNEKECKSSAQLVSNDLEQDNGNSSDLHQKRSGTLLVKTVNKENGTELQSK